MCLARRVRIVELRVRAPIVPLDIFKSRQFSATNGVTLLIYGMPEGCFLLPIELQQVFALQPTAAGASLLPITFMLFALSSRSALSGADRPAPADDRRPLVWQRDWRSSRGSTPEATTS